MYRNQLLFGPLAHARHSCKPNARVTSVCWADIGETIYAVKVFYPKKIFILKRLLQNKALNLFE